MERKRNVFTSKASLEFGEDVPASLHYAVARERRLARHGVVRKGVDGRLRSAIFFVSQKCFLVDLPSFYSGNPAF